MIATHVLAVSTAARCSKEGAAEWSASGPENRRVVLSHRGSIPPPSSILSRGAPGRATCFQTKCTVFKSLPRCQFYGRARQMVSQHIAKVPRGNTRLGSIPRLSAMSVRQLRLAAIGCNPICPGLKIRGL